MQFDTDPQAAAADFFHGGTADGSQLLEEVFAQFGGSLNELSSMRTRIDARATAHASGLAPKVLPWSPGLNTPRISFEASMRIIETAASAFPTIRTSA